MKKLSNYAIFGASRFDNFSKVVKSFESFATFGATLTKFKTLSKFATFNATVTPFRTVPQFATTIILALFLPFLWKGSGVGATKTIDSLRQVIKTAKHDTTRINAYLAWGEQVYMDKPDTALILWQQSLSIADKNLTGFKNLSGLPALKDTLLKQKASALNNIGYIYNNQGDIPKAIEYINKSLKIFEEIGDKNSIAISFYNIGTIYGKQGDIPKALEYFNKSLKIREEIGDKQGMADSFNNIGLIYNNQGDIPKAIEYYNKSLKLYEEIGDKQGMSTSFINIGAIYDNQGDIPKALEYYNKSLKLYEEIGDNNGMALSFNNIGLIYYNQASAAKSRQDIVGSDSLINKAIEYYIKSLKIQEEIGDKEGMAYSFKNIGAIYYKNNVLSKAKSYIEKGYKLSKELGYPEYIEKCAGWLKKVYEKQGNYKLAYQYYKEEILMHDSIQNEENYKKTQKQQAKYEYEKKAATDSIANAKAMEIKDLDLARKDAESKKQRILLFSFLAGFIIILVFSIFLYRLFVQKKMANAILAQQKEEISAQRDEIETQRDLVTEQKDHIEEIHKEVTDSINYAKRIQEAVLPVSVAARSVMGDHFVLFKPKDIVSGDFYWTTKINNWLIVAVADCTGHGVPGAFMSMLGISFLNEIVNKKEITKANQVLNQLRAEIINALQQKGEQGEQKDGMDISLVVIKNHETSPKSQIPSSEQTSDVLKTSEVFEAQWAGANNPLWIVRAVTQSSGLLVEPEVRDTETTNQRIVLQEVKPDKQPIAIHIEMKDFTNHEIQLSKGDTIYLSSDGYEDQFGGEKGKKFLSKNLKQLLQDNCDKPMDEQRNILDTTFENWKGEHEQIDDVTLLGIRI